MFDFPEPDGPTTINKLDGDDESKWRMNLVSADRSI
jgi:hypothetical protein